MPQFTNRYNFQNGQSSMMENDPSYMMQMRDQTMSGQYNQQNNRPMMNQPNTNGWKTYSAPMVTPIVGRWVETFEEIKPQEVPMDGGMYFFPQTDYSCVYAKYWDNNGQLMSFRFLPEKVEQPSKQTGSAEMSDILNGYEQIALNVANRLDLLDGKLADIYERLAPPTVNTTQSVPKQKRSTDKEEK